MQTAVVVCGWMFAVATAERSDGEYEHAQVLCEPGIQRTSQIGVHECATVAVATADTN